MSIVLVGSTSGSITLQEPAVAGTTVLDLPATSGTVAITSQIPAAYTNADALTLFNASGSAPVYACRAWVNFNGTGTVAIRASGNVSSITDNGTGDYTINFTTAMPDANYAVSGTNAFSGANTSLYAIKPYTNGSFAVGSIRINSVFASGGTTDVWDTNTLTVAIFR